MITVIGVGEESPLLLTQRAHRLIDEADVIFGSEHHLAKVQTNAAKKTWLSPFSDNIPSIKKEKKKQIVILATGDPMWFGISKLLLRNFDADELEFISHTSSFNLAAAALKWPIQDCYCLSAHGRSLDSFIAKLQPSQRYLLLTNDATTVHRVDEIVTQHEGHGSRIILLEHLGSPEQRIIECTAGDIADNLEVHFFILALETTPETALHSQLTAGLEDELFINDGQLTKDWMRAITLSRLKPRRGEVLWDIGAGSGSIGIEWARLTSGDVYAIERDENRIAYLVKNKDDLGGTIHITEGDSDESDLYLGLPQPNAIFVGGGLLDVHQIDFFIGNLKPHGRLVINTVTQKGEMILNQAFREYGGNLERFECERMGEIGEHHAYRPSLRVTHWWYQNG